MNKAEGLQALAAVAAKYRGASHSDLASLIQHPVTQIHSARTGKVYQVEVNAHWDDKPGGDLCLSFAVDDGGLRAYFPISRSALVAPGADFDGTLGNTDGANRVRAEGTEPQGFQSLAVVQQSQFDARIDAFVNMWREMRARISPIDGAPWLRAVEGKAGLKFPLSYISLVSRYGFGPIEFELVTLFGNVGDDSDDDISKRPFLDKGLANWLMAKGLLHFASSNIYDPICFDNRSGSAADMPIVRVDHEDILCCRDTVHREVIAQGLFEFLETLGEFVGADRWSDDR